MALLHSCNHLGRGQCPLLIHQRENKDVTITCIAMSAFELPPVICVAERLGTLTDAVFQMFPKHVVLNSQAGGLLRGGKIQSSLFFCKLLCPSV